MQLQMAILEVAAVAESEADLPIPRPPVHLGPRSVDASGQLDLPEVEAEHARAEEARRRVRSHPPGM